jgi:DNA-binding MarR family transcriptional regulator
MPEHLDEAARRVLLMLWNKGPAMPVELAAQCYSFPDEVAPTLKQLEDAGLVEMKPITRSGWGSSLVYLSDLGRHHVTHDLLGGTPSTRSGGGPSTRSGGAS